MRKSLISIALAAICCVCAKAEVNDKFIKNATKEVWAMDAPYFNPNTPIPDTLAKDNSAVIIASLDLIEGDYEQGSSALKGRKLGNRMTNITRRKILTRKMTKLLDDQAVEDNSSFEISAGDMTTLNNYELYSVNHAFGARVHKPDGKVVDVDVSQALSVTSGKDGDVEEGRVLQIPGLEVGDVIETFEYILEEIDELSLRPLQVGPITDYPILNYELRGKFSPYLTVEYRRVNDAPVLPYATDNKGNFVFNLRMKNLPARPETGWFNAARQLPYYRIQILNNNTDMVKRSKVARGPGLYPNIPAATYYREIAERLSQINPNADLVKKVEKFMKDYMKRNPDEGRRSLIDKTYLAMMYMIMINEDIRPSDLMRSLTLRECLDKLKLDDNHTGVGFINGRQTFPTDCLLQYSDVDYVVVAGDSVYQTRYFFNLSPGEFSPLYQGESGAVFYSDFKNPDEVLKLQPSRFTIGKTTFSNNVLYTDMTIDIDTENVDLPVNFNRKVRATGSKKMATRLPLDRLMWIKEIEDCLDVPVNERYVDDGRFDISDESREKSFIADVEFTHGIRPSKITSAEVASLGVTPSNKKTEYSMEGVIEDFVTDAGDGDLFIPIGKLFGRNNRILGKHRKRDFDSDLTAPEQTIFRVTLNIPEGYVLDERSLEQLNVNVQRPSGCYTASASLENDGRQLVVNVIDRNNTYFVPSNRWSDCLILTDAGADFSESSILLTPKK